MRRGLFPGRAFGLFMARWVEQYALRRRYQTWDARPFAFVLSGFEAAWAGLPGRQLNPMGPSVWEYVPRLQAPTEKPRALPHDPVNPWLGSGEQ